MAENEQQCVLAASISQYDTGVGYYRAQHILMWKCLLLKIPFAVHFTCYEYAA
jgi:hypothetical protein